MIKINLNIEELDLDIEITEEQAKTLYNKLHSLFGNKEPKYYTYPLPYYPYPNPYPNPYITWGSTSSETLG